MKKLSPYQYHQLNPRARIVSSLDGLAGFASGIEVQGEREAMQLVNASPQKSLLTATWEAPTVGTGITRYSMNEQLSVNRLSPFPYRGTFSGFGRLGARVDDSTEGRGGPAKNNSGSSSERGSSTGQDIARNTGGEKDQAAVRYAEQQARDAARITAAKAMVTAKREELARLKTELVRARAECEVEKKNSGGQDGGGSGGKGGGKGGGKPKGGILNGLFGLGDDNTYASACREVADLEQRILKVEEELKGYIRVASGVLERVVKPFVPAPPPKPNPPKPVVNLVKLPDVEPPKPVVNLVKLPDVELPDVKLPDGSNDGGGGGGGGGGGDVPGTGSGTFDPSAVQYSVPNDLNVKFPGQAGQNDTSYMETRQNVRAPSKSKLPYVLGGLALVGGLVWWRMRK
jgi:hypothetical protein